MTRAIAASLLLVALAAPARAQDTRPVIREMQLNNQLATSAPQGSVVTAVGRNFHLCPPLPAPQPGMPPPRNECKHEELTIDIGGKDGLILECTFERVTFIIPQDVPIGRKKVRITLRGRGNAEIDFEVTAQLTDAQRAAQAASERGENRAPDAEERIRAEFSITMFELKRDAAGARFEVAGVAGKVPDGFSVVVTLSIEQRDIEQMLATVSNPSGNQGTFRVTFGPYTRSLLFGNYAASCLFELSKQPRVRVRAFRRELRPEEVQVYDRIERREFLQVGTPQEITDQTTAMQNHYRQLSEEMQRLLGEVERAYASGCRQHFKAPGQADFDTARWERYLVEMGFAAPNDPKALDPFRSDLRFATRGGHFKPDDYQQWATTTLIPAVTAAFRRHREFRDSTIATIEPRGELPADALVHIVKATFLEYTRNLYDRSKLELPEPLRALAGVDPVPAQTVSRRFFEAQRRLLLRTVGLRNLVPEGDN